MRKPYVLKKRGKYWYYKLSKEKTYHSTGCTNKTQAENYVIDIINNHTNSNGNRKIVLQTFAATIFKEGQSSWVRKKKSKGRIISTAMLKMREGHLQNHILPQFGQRHIDTITLDELDSWLIDKPLSNRTKNLIIDTLNIVFEEALSKGVVDNNPLKGIDKFVDNPKARDIFTKDELRILFPSNIKERIAIWKSTYWATFFSILQSTGLRLGEVMALTWKDIVNADSEQNCFVVNKSVKNDRSIGTTKTNKEQIALIYSDIYELLQELKTETNYAKDSDLIFPNTKGKPLDRKQCSKMFNEVVSAHIEKNGRNLVVHSLRHTFNTTYRPVLGDEIRLFTGHSDVKMTDHYDHPTTADKIKDIEKYREKMEKEWTSITAG